MDSLILLALVVVVGTPTISLMAFVRTGRLRKLLDQQYLEHRREVSNLKQEIAALHSALARLSKQMEPRASTATSPPAETPAIVR